MKARSRRAHPVLPLFRLEGDGAAALYAGDDLAVVDRLDAEAIERRWTGGQPALAPALEEVAARLEQRARAVEAERWPGAPFTPECLTVHVTNDCQLECSYCYARAHPGAGVVDEESVAAAAHLVAAACADRDRPLHVVLHGGGEPGAAWPRLRSIVHLTRRIAAEHGVGWCGAVTTNGMLDPRRARWLADNMDVVTVSCDGPPWLHDRQRPRAGGGSSSAAVELFCREIVAAGGRLLVRTTITAAGVEHQRAVVAWVHERLGATCLRLEPAYRAGLGPDLAPAFLAHLLAARLEARSRGVALSLSGVRPGEVHGPFCDVLRNVVRVTPGGAAVGCFLAVDRDDARRRGVLVGGVSRGCLVLDGERIAALAARARRTPERCRDCLNLAHCARDCPDCCPAAGEDEAEPGLRCLLQRGLAEAWLAEAIDTAVAAWSAAVLGDDVADVGLLREHLAALPEGIDRGAIRDQWLVARRRYRMEGSRLPSPPWVALGWRHDGDRAWREVSSEAARSGPDEGLSVYLHVPFCDHRCGFCDCSSFPLGRRAMGRNEQVLVGRMVADVEAWSALGAMARRPVTTVHLGGGTPTCLSPRALDRLLGRLRSCLATTASTEWALESTVARLDDALLRHLLELGVRRLHVGVQTLDEWLRAAIGRQSTPEKVCQRLARALELGMVVSVDVVYGLPGQGVGGLLATIRRLVELGVDGLSLYRLNRSRRNRRFLASLGAERDPWREYVMLQAAEQLLEASGYAKNHSTHYARRRDRNLYFTHAVRGEDLLAVGPSAVGSFGSYHYRLGDYRELVGEPGPHPRLAGGVREPPSLRERTRVRAALLGARVTRDQLEAAGLNGLLDVWLAAAMVAPASEPGLLRLRANGSYFLAAMLDEVEAWR